MSTTNPFVSFLGSYGPVPASDNQYDEHIHNAIEKYDIDPIVIETGRLGDLLQNFTSNSPDHVILTGTAGDGKTFHCRRVWEELTGGQKEWGQGNKSISVQLAQNNAKLTIVKDLSELTETEKDKLFEEFCPALESDKADNVFLIAANDGQLLSSLKTWTNKHGHKSVFDIVEELLVEEQERRGSLRLYNLSREDPSDDFNGILDGIVEHPSWSWCEGCPLYGSAESGMERCPIRLNRSMLRGSDDGSQFRKRLTELLTLSKANGLHMPIRHLFLLAVNVILGDQKSRILTCTKAKNRARNNDYGATNPYSNVFGDNLPVRERAQYRSFSVLNSYGIGKETNNDVDDLLIYGPYRQEAEYEKKVRNDRIYGASNNYEELRRDYVEEGRQREAEFIDNLVVQRRRLFFTLDSHDKLRPWDLTVFRSAGEYLEFRDMLNSGLSTRVTERKLVLGINRTFCGMMIEDTRKVYVTFSGGDGRGRISSVLMHEIDSGRRAGRICVEFAPGPRMKICDGSGVQVIGLNMRLTHFEYLIRVASGSLPANFSRQCYEDFMDLKTKIIENLEASFDPSVLYMLDVQPDGHPRIDQIDLQP